MPRPKGGYKLKDGTRVPGVTTITGRFKDSSNLMYWAAEQGKAMERGEISYLYEKRDEAGEAGTLAHKWVQMHIAGKEIIVGGKDDPIIKYAKRGFDNFLSWKALSFLDVVDQEIELVSEKHKFGGCPDAILVNTKSQSQSLGDWKNSSGVYTDHLLQLAAYKALWDENYPDRPLDGGFHLCRFSKEHADFSHHHYAELGDALEMFILLRRAYDLDKKLKRRV